MDSLDTKACDLNFLVNYPCVIANKDNTCYSGFIFVNDQVYQINLKKNNNSTYKLDICNDLLAYNEDIIKIESEQSFQHPVEFLDALTKLISSKTTAISKVPTIQYRKILQEFQEFQNFFVYLDSCHLNNDLSGIKLTYCDDNRRNHFVNVSIIFSEDTKRVAFKLQDIDLPIDDDLEIVDESLVNVYQQFMDLVQAYQGFLDLMQYIDLHCWVLDPENPTYKDAFRRIALNEHLSVVVFVHAKCPHGLPKIKALGPINETESLYERLSNNYEKWDPSGDFLEELTALIGVEALPPKRINRTQRNCEELLNIGECCICFMKRHPSNDELPEITCANVNCNQIFHNDCLFQWLQTLPDSNVMLQRILGKCPNCSRSISCNIQK